jgi:Glycosyl transferase family 2
MPNVSVVIPTFNRGTLVGRAIRSVLPQLEEGDEIIVVDDESTDDSASVIQAFGAPVRYVRNVHRGLACGSARNRGVAEARHPFVAFLDSDDEWLPGKLALQRRFLEARPDVVFCFSNFECRNDDGTYDPHGLVGWHHDTRDWDDILAPGVPYSSVAALPAGQLDVRVHIGNMYPVMLRSNYVAAQTMLVRASLAGDLLKFAEDISIQEEYDSFARLTRLGPVAYFDCRTFVQWGHGGQRMTRDAGSWEQASARLVVLGRVWGRDREFLAAHGEAYRRAVATEHIIRARVLIREGRMRQAREELRLAVDPPLYYRAASLLPGAVTRGAAQFLRCARTLKIAAAALAMPLAK